MLALVVDLDVDSGAEEAGVASPVELEAAVAIQADSKVGVAMVVDWEGTRAMPDQQRQQDSGRGWAA